MCRCSAKGGTPWGPRYDYSNAVVRDYLVGSVEVGTYTHEITSSFYDIAGGEYQHVSVLTSVIVLCIVYLLSIRRAMSLEESERKKINFWFRPSDDAQL